MAPLTSRKNDLAYFCFFAMFTTTMIFMDLIPLWPKAVLPKVLKDNHTWYLNTFNDQLMIKFEPWFAAFVVFEALYQLPMSIWFLFALPKSNPKFPAHLLVYSTTGILTTATSCVAIYKDADMNEQQKCVLLAFYGPFVLVFAYMAGDMFCRIQSKMAPAAAKAKKTV